MKEIIINKADSESASEIAAFLGFKDDSFWKYEYCSYMPEKSVFIAGYADNQIVGAQAFMPYYLSINDKPVLTGRSERTLLNKAYRGLGNLNALMDNAFRFGQAAGMVLVWGSTLAGKAFEKAGFLSLQAF